MTSDVPIGGAHLHAQADHQRRNDQEAAPDTQQAGQEADGEAATDRARQAVAPVDPAARGGARRAGGRAALQHAHARSDHEGREQRRGRVIGQQPVAPPRRRRRSRPRAAEHRRDPPLDLARRQPGQHPTTAVTPTTSRDAGSACCRGGREVDQRRNGEDRAPAAQQADQDADDEADGDGR